MRVRVQQSPESPPNISVNSNSTLNIPEVSPISEVSVEVKVSPETSTKEDEKSPDPTSPAKSVADADTHCKLVQKQLVLLLHSHACLKKDGVSSPEERPRCVVPNCQMMRGVWVHLKACEVGLSCSFRHCSSSQKILAHWKACRVMECPVCHIVRLKWAQMQVAKEAAASSASSSSAKDNTSEESHLDDSSGQSTTSLSQGYGQGQGRLPHRTMGQGSGNVVDNQLHNSDCGNESNNEPINHYEEESNSNATTAATATTGSSSTFLEEGGRGRSHHTCHEKSSSLLQANHLYNQQVQQQLMLQQMRQSSRYHRPAYHKLMAHLPSNLQFQSQHQRHSHVHANQGSSSINRQVQPVMSHYYDEQSTPPPLLMTMTLTRDDKAKRKIHDCLPCPSLSKVRICCGGGHSSDLPETFSTRNCQCRISDGFLPPRENCVLMGHRSNSSSEHVHNPQQQRLILRNCGGNEDMEASAVASFQEMIDETLGCSRVGVPNSYEEQSVPSADDVRKAYERLGIPCPSDALNRLLATLPGGSKFLSAASSDASSECGSEFDSQSSPAPSRRNSDDDGIEDGEYNTIEDDCQVSFCLSLVQRLVAKSNDDPHVDDNDDSSSS